MREFVFSNYRHPGDAPANPASIQVCASLSSSGQIPGKIWANRLPRESMSTLDSLWRGTPPDRWFSIARMLHKKPLSTRRIWPQKKQRCLYYGHNKNQSCLYYGQKKIGKKTKLPILRPQKKHKSKAAYTTATKNTKLPILRPQKTQSSLYYGHKKSKVPILLRRVKMSVFAYNNTQTSLLPYNSTKVKKRRSRRRGGGGYANTPRTTCAMTVIAIVVLSIWWTFENNNSNDHHCRRCSVGSLAC